MSVGMGQIAEIATAVSQVKQVHQQAKVAPAEIRAKIAIANASRAEAIVKELTAYKTLLDMGALPEEDYEAHKARLMDSLKPENDTLSGFDDDEDEDEGAEAEDAEADAGDGDGERAGVEDGERTPKHALL